MTNGNSPKRNICLLTRTKFCLILFSVGVIILHFNSQIFNKSVFDMSKCIPPQHGRLCSGDKPLCSSSILKDYIRTHDFFPEHGTWIMKNAQPVSWIPELCHFSTSRLQEKILQCIESKELDSFLILGDSNGLRYAKALVKLLSLENKTACRTIRREGLASFKPDIKYFTNRHQIELTDFLFHSRDCSGCKSKMTECSLNGRKIKVDYVGMEFVLDTEITTYRNFHDEKSCKPGQQCFQSNTYQEMIFSEYLKHQYPDVIMLFQNSHDRMRKSLAVFDANINYLVKLLENVVPLNTTVVWLSEVEEYLPKKKALWRNVTFEGGFNNSEHIHEINKRLFNAIKPIVGKPNSNMHGFFDLQKLSHTVLPYWSKDGVHVNPSWYRIIVSYIMQTLCA